MIDFTQGAAAEEAPDLDKLETALTLARNSREFNRKRVEVLDDRLHRIRAILDEEAALQQENEEYHLDRIKRLEEENQRLARQVCEFDRDRHTERDRADKAVDALIKVRAEREEQDAELRRRASAIKVLESRYETLLATLDKAEDDGAEAAAEHRRSLAARDSLLAAATTRVRAAQDILGARRVQEAADQIVTSKGAILADAIRNAHDALTK